MKLSDILATEREVEPGAKYLSEVQRIIDAEASIFGQNPNIELVDEIPLGDSFPINDKLKWLKVPAVNACFVDMARSTKMSASKQPQVAARAYRFFTQTAVDIFDFFDASYIDVRGDGILALFDKGKEHTALAATVSFKSFVEEYFAPKMIEKYDVDVAGHYGIDRRAVLVRRIGKRLQRGKSQRRNEVWAGSPVNFAAKLASISADNRLTVSPQFFSHLRHEQALESCGCGSFAGIRSSLWSDVDVRHHKVFSFNDAHELTSSWCKEHGRATCKALVEYEADY